MTTSKRFTFATMVLAISLAGANMFAADAGPGGLPPMVTVGRVERSEMVDVKRYTGHVVSASTVNLVARVSGELLEMGFKEGGMVHKGQVLYQLDPVRYEAEVKNVESRIAEYEARLDYAELSYNRAENLYRQSAGTKDSLDSMESEHKAAKAALLAAEAQLITTKDDLENTKIIAPISGKIGISNYTVGNYLTPNSGTIATIVQLDPLRVSFSMSNRDFLSLFGTEDNLKQHADIRLRLADDSLYDQVGEVEFVDNQANQRTDTIHIYASFANPKGVLVPGSTVTVLLSRHSGTMAPSVSPSAVMHDAKVAYVYVVDGENRIQRREVVLGGGDNSTQIILSGLEPGELVVVDGMHKAMPGSVIEPDFQS